LRAAARSQPLWTKDSCPSGRTSVTVACRSTFGVDAPIQASSAPAPMTVVSWVSGAVT
jgi:hypothetical protein